MRYDLTKFLDKVGELAFYDDLASLLENLIIDYLKILSKDEYLSPAQRAFCKRLLNLLENDRAEVDFDIKIWIIERGES